MYTAGPPGQVAALDAKTGLQIWKYERARKAKNPYESNPFNRGVAVLGNRVFVGTLDAALVALDARTGLPLWETQVADSMHGYSLTMSPLAVKDKIVVGVAGASMGFADSWTPTTRQPASGRGGSTPFPGRARWATIRGRAIRGSGGRRGTWLTGSYDPELNLTTWDDGESGAGYGRQIGKATTCSVVPWWRCMPTRACGSGTTSSRRATTTIGTRTRVWCWPIG